MEPELREAIHTVLRGFDKQVFLRNTDGDGNSGWAFHTLPYIMALALLAKESEYDPT
jgi:hypothetical protein